MTHTPTVAVLYQAVQPPEINGIIKPMKPGGYSDSGADIAYTLQSNGIDVITPSKHPQSVKDLDWVFPDTRAGIKAAIDLGANTLWLNTVLYKSHPIQEFQKRGIYVVGQSAENTELYDDKWNTNMLLKQNGLPIPDSELIDYDGVVNFKQNLPFPLMVKPLRGRGSEGVVLVLNNDQFKQVTQQIFEEDRYGTMIYLERFLTGQELTLTVMPPGHYNIKGHFETKKDYWSLPAVKRFNHKNGVAPYNGVVAVIKNSIVLDELESNSALIRNLEHQCQIAARLVGAKAPIRIDCRSDDKGDYFLFDLNMKPNMTGATRPGRQDQDSLTALAARKIGWSYADLLSNMLFQRWKY